MVVSLGVFANRGAGGRGLLGLPPYCDEGVPGLGLPLRSAGSYCTGVGGGRDQSSELLVGDTGRRGMLYGGMDGALPRLDGGLDVSYEGAPLRWYRSDVGLAASKYLGISLLAGDLLRVTWARSDWDLPVTI